jgi:hypothetical protein
MAPDYAIRFSGWINIPLAGPYEFILGTHEGARLRIGDVTVVDVSSSTGVYQEGRGAITLPTGLVPIEVTYFEGAGNSELQLSFIPPGGESQVVPPSSLVPRLEPFRVTTDASGTFSLEGIPSALEAVGLRIAVRNDVEGVTTTVAPVGMRPNSNLNVGDIVVALPRR